MTSNYTERSTLISFRFFFGWVGGNAMTVLMFGVVFIAMATPEIRDGRFNPASYQIYGAIAAVLIFLSIIISSVGTHSQIPHLLKPTGPTKRPVSQIMSEIRIMFWERNFLALFIAAIFGAMATGFSSALSFIFYTYFWEFSSAQIMLLTLAVFGSAIFGATLAPVVTRWMGKKPAAMVIGLIAFLGSPLPIVLRLTGILPDNGDPIVFWIVFFTILIDVGLIICFQILTTSMMADLIEQHEIRTHQRAEGVFASSKTFIRKLVQGVGMISATTVLTLAEFPTGATPGDVSPETLYRLGLYYVPTLLSIWMVMMLVMNFYNLKREDHERNVEELARRKADAEGRI